ncbi:hypothetical protein [Methylocystis parvus]|uniref:hypothetical protein n=1 Tax=Methylocystis parvus TaxID=134 RepID=UPI003C7892EE
MKIKMLSPWAGDRESLAPGDVTDRPDDVAKAWIAAGMAIEAPAGDVAAQRIRDLTAALDDTRASRDGLAATIIDAAAAVEAAKKEAEAAIAERDIHRAAADEARAELIAAREANDALKADFARTFGDAKSAYEAKISALTEERDEFKRQAETLAEQLGATSGGAEIEALKARGVELEGALEAAQLGHASREMDLAAANARVADLEAQLAAAAAPKGRKAAAAAAPAAEAAIAVDAAPAAEAAPAGDGQ